MVKKINPFYAYAAQETSLFILLFWLNWLRNVEVDAFRRLCHFSFDYHVCVSQEKVLIWSTRLRASLQGQNIFPDVYIVFRWSFLFRIINSCIKILMYQCKCKNVRCLPWVKREKLLLNSRVKGVSNSSPIVEWLKQISFKIENPKEFFEWKLN